jgi:hypothetical protein
VKNVWGCTANKTASPLPQKVISNTAMHLKREMGNKIAMQSNVVTPIKLLKLDRWLKDYSKEGKDFLLHGFQFGFRIP